jgi:PAS domain S-box-containing protein
MAEKKKPKTCREKVRNSPKKTTSKILKEITKAEGIINAIGFGLSILDRSFKILYENQFHKNMLGGNVGEFCYKAYRKRDVKCSRCPVSLTFKDGKVRTVKREAHTDKGTRCFEITSSPLRGSSGQIIAGVEIVRDITEQKQTEEALLERERQLNESQRMAHIGSWERDVATNRVVWSDEMYRILGFDPQEDEPSYEAFLNIIHPDDREFFIKAGKSAVYENKPYSFDYRIIRKDGTISVIHARGKVFYDEAGNPFLFRGTAQDITKRKRLEEQLLQAQKMEAIGQLAGGIAHDFNNILTAIIGFGNLLKIETVKDGLSGSYITQILNSAERAANLTQALLAFSRKQIITPKTVNLNVIIQGIEKLLSRVIGEDIKLSTILTDKNLTIMADSGQIEQVLMNLATNARDAMPDGGNLIIGTELVEFSNEFTQAHGYGKPGQYALITFEDTGQGMDEKTKERIFEPFYTTKEVGKGTGLGLAMVYGIIKQHNGYINVYSKQNKGTIFKIYLPLIKSEVEETKLKNMLVLKGGRETVLVAEDDEPVRELIKELLLGYGYNVIEAGDGKDAIRAFNKNKDRIQLLILDVIMPKKNGKEVYDEIRELKPDMKVIFVSGYNEDVIHKKGVLDEGLNFISKPILLDELLRKVREVLDKRDTG